MYYAPHILERRRTVAINDRYGRYLHTKETWEAVCRCRCDKNSDREFQTENGGRYRPAYHIVCEGRVDIAAGDYIRCVFGSTIIGEGKVYTAKSLNMLPYSECYV